jgi:hypothetical protein
MFVLVFLYYIHTTVHCLDRSFPELSISSVVIMSEAKHKSKSAKSSSKPVATFDDTDAQATAAMVDALFDGYESDHSVASKATKKSSKKSASPAKASKSKPKSADVMEDVYDAFQNELHPPAAAPAAPAAPTKEDKNKSKKSKRKASHSSSDSSSSSDDSEDDKHKRKKKRSKKKKHITSSDDDSSSSSSSDSDDDSNSKAFTVKKNSSEAAPSSSAETLLKPRVPVRSTVVTPVAPPDSLEYVNPNATILNFSKKNGCNSSYSQFNPLKDFFVDVQHTTKDKETKTWIHYKTNKTCKFLDPQTGKLEQTKFNEPFIISPFMAVQRCQVYPHGNKDAIPDERFPSGGDPSKMKYRFIASAESYAQSLETNNEGSVVDYDAHQFLTTWWSQLTEFAHSAPVLKHAQYIFPKAFLKIKDSLDKEATEAAEAAAKWSKMKPKHQKYGTPPMPMDYAKSIRDKLALEHKDAGSVSEFNHIYTIYIATPFFRGVSPSEKAPTVFMDEWVRQAWDSPLDYKTSSGEIKPGWKRVMRALPMFRCITMEERRGMDKLASGCPYKPIPRSDSFVVDGDVIAFMFGYCGDDKTTDKIRAYLPHPVLKGLLWLGIKGTFDESRVPDPSLDPTTYVVLAQPYTRTKANFVPPAAVSSKNKASTSKQDQCFSDFSEFAS